MTFDVEKWTTINMRERDKRNNKTNHSEKLEGRCSLDGKHREPNYHPSNVGHSNFWYRDMYPLNNYSITNEQTLGGRQEKEWNRDDNILELHCYSKSIKKNFKTETKN